MKTTASKVTRHTELVPRARPHRSTHRMVTTWLVTLPCGEVKVFATRREALAFAAKQ
jgi:hypothetical protein